MTPITGIVIIIIVLLIAQLFRNATFTDSPRVKHVKNACENGFEIIDWKIVEEDGCQYWLPITKKLNHEKD